jgi:hypothetical protein
MGIGMGADAGEAAGAEAATAAGTTIVATPGAALAAAAFWPRSFSISEIQPSTSPPSSFVVSPPRFRYSRRLEIAGRLMSYVGVGGLGHRR